jgi:cellobiose dehydrogenase (acceptor)
MVQALLLMAWPHEGKVLTSFRWATDFFMPGPYIGNATVTQISSAVNDSSYELIYRCQNCLSWEQDGTSAVSASTQGFLILGRAAAAEGPDKDTAGCPDDIVFGFHTNGYGQWLAPLENVTSSSYEKWAALATQAVPRNCGGSASAATNMLPAFQ